MTDNNRYTGLNALRGIAALLIFYHHFDYNNDVTQAFGDFAVSLFFMLSGLVLSISYSSRPVSISPLATVVFLKKRLLKIYPVYLLSLIIALIVFGFNYRALPLDILLLQSWVPLPSYYFSGNAVSWFLSTLIFLYITFLPLSELLRKHARSFILLFTTLITIYLPAISLIPDSLVTGIIYIFPVMELPTFILGILAWHLFTRIDILRISNLTASLLQIVSILATIIFIHTYPYVDQRYSLVSFWWIPNFLILSIMLLSESHDTILNKLFRSKALQTLGNISFVFYLFHTIIITLYRFALEHFSIGLSQFISSLICLAITIVVVLFIHRYMEIPIARALKSHIGSAN